MQKRYITKKAFQSATYMNTYQHTESDLYLFEGDLLKILQRKLAKEREEIVLELSQTDMQSCALPIYGLYSKRYGFEGYAMHYYKEYLTLTKQLMNKNFSYAKRIECAKKICEILDSFKSYKYAYHDVNSNNILVNANDVIITDLDSGVFKSTGGETEYLADLLNSYRRLAPLTLSILYGVNPDEFDEFFQKNKKRLLDMSNLRQKRFIEYAIEQPFKHFPTLEYLDDFNEDFIGESKEIIRKKI